MPGTCRCRPDGHVRSLTVPSKRILQPAYRRTDTLNAASKSGRSIEKLCHGSRSCWGGKRRSLTCGAASFRSSRESAPCSLLVLPATGPHVRGSEHTSTTTPLKRKSTRYGGATHSFLRAYKIAAPATTPEPPITISTNFPRGKTAQARHERAAASHPPGGDG